MLCTTKLAETTSQYYFVLKSFHKLRPSTTLYYKALHKALPSTTLYYKACTNYVPVLLCTYTACTNYFPVLLCTTRLAQSTSQYYFVLQSLHKALPSTTVYYKAGRNYFPVLLCTIKLAQSTSQYYFVQGLHKVVPSTTLYYKRARFCSFLHRHGDARGKAETEVLQLPPKTRRRGHSKTSDVLQLPS